MYRLSTYVLSAALAISGCSPVQNQPHEQQAVSIESIEDTIKGLAQSSIERGMLYDRITGESTIVSTNGSKDSAEIDLDLLAANVQIGGSYVFVHNHVMSPTEVLKEYKNLAEQSQEAVETLGDIITLLEEGQTVAEYRNTDIPYLQAKKNRFEAENRIWNAYITFYEQDLNESGFGSSILNVLPSTGDLTLFKAIDQHIMQPRRAQCTYVLVDTQGYMTCNLTSRFSEDDWLEWKDSFIASAPSLQDDEQSWADAFHLAAQRMRGTDLVYKKFQSTEINIINTQTVRYQR